MDAVGQAILPGTSAVLPARVFMDLLPVLSGSSVLIRPVLPEIPQPGFIACVLYWTLLANTGSSELREQVGASN